MMDQIELVARSDTPVLILGETGAGKEVVALAIHERSRRAPGPFLRVNCGAIPPDLVDSELFGHERGQLHRGGRDAKGWFEAADGGTLFLDECGELTPAAQVRLLRILQDGTFERVGGERQLHVDVRIVAATHRDMAEMIGDGRFRQDLWYRLAVFPIRLPPLRDRPADSRHGSPLRHEGRQAARAAADGTDRRGCQSACHLPVARQCARAGCRDQRAAILGGGVRLDVARALGHRPPAVRRLQPMPGRRFRRRASGTAAFARNRHGPAHRGGPGTDRGTDRRALRRRRSLGDQSPHAPGRMRKLGVDWQGFRSPARAKRGPEPEGQN